MTRKTAKTAKIDPKAQPKSQPKKKTAPAPPDPEAPAAVRPKGGVQPKTQASKAKAAVKIRRKKIVKAIIEGKTLKEAGILAGYKPENADSQVCKALQHPQTQSDFLKAMEKAGLGDDYWIELHAKLAKGKRYLPVRGLDAEAPNAPGYIAVEDHQAQAKALDIAHKLAGRYTEKHEVDLKRPVNIIIKKFASRTQSTETPKTSG